MCNCVLHVKQLLANICFLFADDISVLTSGTYSLVWGFVKNVVGRLQFVKNSHSAGNW